LAKCAKSVGTEKLVKEIVQDENMQISKTNPLTPWKNRESLVGANGL